MLPGSGRKWFFLARQEKWREPLCLSSSWEYRLMSASAATVLVSFDGHSPLYLQTSKVQARIRHFSFGIWVKWWFKAHALISPFTLWKAETIKHKPTQTREKRPTPAMMSPVLAWPYSCFMQTSSHNAHKTPRQSCHCDKSKWYNDILLRHELGSRIASKLIWSSPFEYIYILCLVFT